MNLKECDPKREEGFDEAGAAIETRPAFGETGVNNRAGGVGLTVDFSSKRQYPGSLPATHSRLQDWNEEIPYDDSRDPQAGISMANATAVNS
jgi:hypothetical protein